MPHPLPPGPRAPKSVQLVAWWNRPTGYLERCRDRYGKRFTVRLPATPPFVMLSDPEEIKQVLTAPPDVLHPGEGARLLEPVVGTHSVILLDEKPHLTQRKLMLPAFHGAKMEALTDLVRDVAEREVATWPLDEPVELHPRLQALTLEIILRGVFGMEPGERLDTLRARLVEVLDVAGRPFGMLPQTQRRLAGFGPWARFIDARDEVDRILAEVIAERRAEPDADRDDVLAMLPAARHEDGSPMSAQELRDELMTLLVAGHETTASQLAWALNRLAAEPRVTATLVSAIDADEGDEYLNATIHEVMRRRPVLPNAAPRLVKRPITVGGIDYEPGPSLVASSYLVHHDPEIYPDPYAFRPERFLGVKPGTYTWIPFGGGRRRCLGASFALLEMRVVLRAVLERNELVPGPVESTRRRAITISPKRSARTVMRRRAKTRTRPPDRRTESSQPVPAGA
jgi:cytochrome P450